MRLSCRLLIALYLLLFPFVMQAQESSGESKAISRIFEAISIEDKLSEVPQDLHAQFSQNPFGLPSSQNEQMMDLFLEAFASDTLLVDARKAFHQNYSPEHADSTINWLNTEITQKVLDVRKEFYTLQGIRKQVVNKYELEQNPSGKNRTELIRTLAQNLSAAESKLESRAIIFRAVVSAFSELSNQQSFSETQIDGFVSNYRNQMQTQIDQNVTGQLLLMYHGLENDVLKKYIAFYETAPGNWLSSTTSESIHAAYRSASDRFIESIRNL